VLINRHYTNNCIKLTHNKAVLYTHFTSFLLYLHNNAGNVCITKLSGDLCNHFAVEKQ